MNIWRATYRDDDSGSGTVQVWGTSERDVRRKLAAAKALEPSGFDIYRVERMTIRTKRAEIVRFLNLWADCA